MKIIPNYQLFTDGACSGNPGPGGYGYLWLSPDFKVFEGGGFSPDSTNNQMELTAILEGIRARPKDALSITLYTDSRYALDGLTKYLHRWVKNGFKTTTQTSVKNETIWQQLYNEILNQNEFRITYQWVKGHAGIPLQERVDDIARLYSLSMGAPTPIHLRQGESVDPVLHAQAGQVPKKSFDAYYLVYKNNHLSRYSTWEDCKKAVSGEAKVRYKKIHRAEEEQECMRKWGLEDYCP